MNKNKKVKNLIEDENKFELNQILYSIEINEVLI